MNIIQLRDAINGVIESAENIDVNPESIEVSVQIDGQTVDSVWAADEMEVHYDNNGLASGCVITAVRSV